MLDVAAVVVGAAALAAAVALVVVVDLTVVVLLVLVESVVLLAVLSVLAVLASLAVLTVLASLAMQPVIIIMPATLAVPAIRRARRAGWGRRRLRAGAMVGVIACVGDSAAPFMSDSFGLPRAAASMESMIGAEPQSLLRTSWVVPPTGAAATATPWARP